MIEAVFPEALVTGYEDLVPTMKNDPSDRHVAAVAVKSGAQVIVTWNLTDFKELPDDIEAKDPDEFLCELFDLKPSAMSSVIDTQAENMTRPPRTPDELLNALEKQVPRFVEAVRQWRSRRRGKHHT